MVEPELDDLRRSEERLRAVIESSPLAIVEADLETRVILWNPAAERIFGWTREEMLGRADVPMVPDSKRKEHEHLAAVVRSGHAISVLTRTAVPFDLHVVSAGLPLLPTIGIALEFSEAKPSLLSTTLAEHVRTVLPGLKTKAEID